MSGKKRCDNGAKSPDAPTEPRSEERRVGKEC